MLMGADDRARRSFEMQPCEVTRPPADERLRESEKRHEQARRDRVEFRLNPRPKHVGDGDAKSPTEHDVRHDPQPRQKNSEPEKKNGEREPFDAAQITGDFRLRSGIDRLEKAFAKNAVVDDGPVDEPAETRRAVNLAAPLRGTSRTEEDQMLETQERFGFAVPFLLFAKSAERESVMMPDDRGGTESNRVSGLLHAPAKIHVVSRRVILRIEPTDIFESPAIPRHVTTRNVLRDRVGKQDMARSAGRGGEACLNPVLRGRRNVRSPYSRVIAAQKRAH